MIQIIPAIDLIDGKCVRLTQGDYNQKTEYSSNPLEVAKAFEGAGIQRLIGRFGRSESKAHHQP